MSSFKNTGFPIPLFNPLGFRTSGNLLQDLIKNCGLLSYNTPETDKVGRTSYDSVIAQDVVGDGVSYIDTKISPDDLPNNYKISGKGIYNDNDLTLPAFFGASNNSPTRFYLATDNADTKDIILGFYDTVSRLNVNLSLGQDIEWEILVTPTTYNITVNGVSSGVINYTKVSISTNINLLSRDGTSYSNHQIHNFEIENTDTNEIIAKLVNEERQSDGITILKKYDAQGNFIENIMGEQFFSPAIPTVDNNFRRSEANEKGVSIAKALGDNETRENYVNGFVDPNTGLYSANVTTRSLEEFLEVGFHTIKLTGGNTRLIIAEFDSKPNFGDTGNVIFNGIGLSEATFEITNFKKWVVVYVDNTGNEPQAMLNKGAVALPYESWQGYYIDEALVYPYQDGIPITADSKGLLTAWIDNGQGVGIRPSVNARGPIKMDMVVCDVTGTPTGLPFESGGYIRSKDIYGKRNNADTNEILRNPDGTPKVIAYDDMAIYTPAVNPQMMVSADKNKILLFEEPLIDDSECYDKANKLLGFNGTALDSEGFLAVDINDELASE